MTKFIAIDGRGGSGKTYVSNLLAKHIGASVFHLDEYGDDFKPFIGIPALIDELRRVDVDIVIYEGIGVFGSRFDEFKAFRIFVDTSNNVRSSRVKNRDIPRDGRTTEDWRQIFAIWDKAEKEYFTPELIQSADLTIDNDNRINLEVVVKQLRLF